MLKNENIICVSSIDWDFVWQGHQEIMSTFADNENRVLFIENTGVRPPRLSDIGRLTQRIRNWRKGLKGIRQESKNLFIYSPLILPFPYSNIAKVINRFILINTLKAWMRAVNFKNPIIWTFLPTSVSIDIIDKIDHSLAVYYCIAEFTELASSSRKVNKAEAELLKRCDVVFAQGEKIKQRCLKYNDNCHIFPFGVKMNVFLRAAGSSEMPDDMKTMKRPVLGYIGGIHKHVDFDLLGALADANPGASIALVGPVQTDEAKVLRNKNNVHFLGKKEHVELPDYVDAFDLCLIPYLVTEYTETVYPTKLNEYLMRGKRVLSSAMPEVIKFAETFGNVVSIAKDNDDFVKKAKELLATPEDAKSAEARRTAAGNNSWERRIEEMSGVIQRAMEARKTEMTGSWKANFVRFAETAKRRTIAIAASFSIVYMLIFYTPLIWWIAEPLKTASPLSHADVIVALGGGTGETGRAGQGYEERVKYAAELYKKGYAKKIIFSSGFVYAFKEPDVMKLLAISLGVSPEDVILESQAGNTYESVKYSLAIAGARGYKNIIFVSSPYNMRRLKMAAEKAGGSAHAFIYSPIPYSRFYGNGKSVAPRQIKAILKEYLAILYYKVKGYV